MLAVWRGENGGGRWAQGGRSSYLLHIFLWILQVMLALHTAMGAVWKFSHSVVQTMPSLKAIPQSAWLAMSVFELLVSVGLILPAVAKPLGFLAPIGAACIAVEMLLFCALHLNSGDGTFGPICYWLVVAAICGFVAHGRFVVRPL